MASESNCQLPPAALGLQSNDVTEMTFGSWGSPKRPGDRRVYSSGVRLEELLRWPAVDACRALHAYALEMSGEDTDAFFSALPQITNCVLGLDHANGAQLPLALAATPSPSPSRSRNP